MKPENFKTRFWNKKTKEMLYGEYAIWDGDILKIIYEDDGEYIHEGYEYISNVIPMLALPVKDVEGNRIYDEDILECSISEYYDPYGIQYPNSNSVKFAADIYDSYAVPTCAKIVGNRYETPELYREVMWDRFLSDQWDDIERKAKRQMLIVPAYRYGQSLYITTWNAASDEVKKQIEATITATEYDPFNNDGNVDKFKEKIIDLWIDDM